MIGKGQIRSESTRSWTQNPAQKAPCRLPLACIRPHHSTNNGENWFQKPHFIFKFPKTDHHVVTCGEMAPSFITRGISVRKVEVNSKRQHTLSHPPRSLTLLYKRYRSTSFPPTVGIRGYAVLKWTKIIQIWVHYMSKMTSKCIIKTKETPASAWMSRNLPATLMELPQFFQKCVAFLLVRVRIFVQRCSHDKSFNGHRYWTIYHTKQ